MGPLAFTATRSHNQARVGSLNKQTMLKKIILLAAGLSVGAAIAQISPYAGQQTRSIKSLSEREIADLETGQGMALAKAAELNGYPGPAHVLEHADGLALSVEQRAATQALLARHKATARQLGAQLVERERALDQAFATRQIDAAGLSQLTRAIGELQARLREEHLRTHLTQTALLEPGQIQRYSVLRGYSADPAGTAAPQSAPSSHGDHH
jgi:Spy/CpxP family protein refolding chaperone